MIERLYFDSCILNRLGDDQLQLRIRSEAAAVSQPVELAAAARIEWIASSIVQLELSKNPDPSRRSDALVLLTAATEFVQPKPATFERARVLRTEGYGDLDALHLAVAEQAHATFLLTVDDRFLRKAQRSASDLAT